MAWTLHAITLRVDTDAMEGEAFIAVQEVLDATSETTDWYGAGSQRRTLGGILDENENSNTGRSTLETDRATDANLALVSDQGAEGNYRIERARYQRVQALNKTNPVWRFELNLIKV